MKLAPWLLADWPAPPGVRAFCTTRGVGADAGASRGPWQRFNLGAGVGDDPAAVAANRARLTQSMGARPVFLRQIHGVDAIVLDESSDDGTSADAAITFRPGLACTVLVGDCLPILLADARGQRLAAIHAGWRSLVGGVVERTLGRFRTLADGPGQEEGILAWLGPCIGPEAFEVGEEVRAAFVAADERAAACFRPLGAGKHLADLPALARQRLAAQGIPRAWGNDGSPPWCTVGNPQRFFSHRRDQRTLGSSGRMAACIWRD